MVEERWERHYIAGAKRAAGQKSGPFFILGMLTALLESEVTAAEKVEQAQFLLEQYNKERGISCDVV